MLAFIVTESTQLVNFIVEIVYVFNLNVDIIKITRVLRESKIIIVGVLA